MGLLHDLIWAGYTPGEIPAAGGGGGSSDFSTAEVTITNNLEDVVDFHGPIIIMAEDENEEDEFQMNVIIPPSTEITIKVVLYKGSSAEMVAYANDDDAPEAAVTGDIHAEGGTYIITGNGTMTFAE